MRWVLAIIAAAGLGGCADEAPPPHLWIEGADPVNGRRLIEARFGCGACHVIPGIRSARGMTGPPLTDFAQRNLFAGEFPNAPRFLIPWLLDPPSLAPRTGMPNLGIAEREARDIASYLYTLGAGEVRVYPRLPAFSLGQRDDLVRIDPSGSPPATANGDPAGYVPIPIEQAMRHLVEQARSRRSDQ